MGCSSLLYIIILCAYLSAAATIITLVSVTPFFKVGEPFGMISDVSSVVQVVLMSPLAMALYRLLPVEMQTSALLATL